MICSLNERCFNGQLRGGATSYPNKMYVLPSPPQIELSSHNTCAVTIEAQSLQKEPSTEPIWHKMPLSVMLMEVPQKDRRLVIV